MTSKQRLRVIDLVINLGCRVRVYVFVCVFKEPLSVHTWIRLLVFNCGVPLPTSMCSCLLFYWLAYRANTSHPRSRTQVMSAVVAGQPGKLCGLWQRDEIFQNILHFKHWREIKNLFQKCEVHYKPEELKLVLPLLFYFHSYSAAALLGLLWTLSNLINSICHCFA